VKWLQRWVPAIVCWIAYFDMVLACFATAAGRKDLALLLTASAMLLVVGAFAHVLAHGDSDE